MSKYIIKKADGRPIAKKAQYFVLRLDYHGTRLDETAAARVALDLYARECVTRAVMGSSSRPKLLKCAEAAKQALNDTRAENMEP